MLLHKLYLNKWDYALKTHKFLILTLFGCIKKTETYRKILSNISLVTNNINDTLSKWKFYENNINYNINNECIINTTKKLLNILSGNNPIGLLKSILTEGGKIASGPTKYILFTQLKIM